MSLRKGNVRTEVTLEGDREMVARLKSVEKGIGGLGKGAQGIIGSLGQMGAVAGVAAAGASVLAAELRLWAEAAQFAARQTYELVQRSGAVGDVAAAFERIADPNTLTRLQAVTGGIVDNMRLMSEFTQVSRAGVLGENEIVSAFELVTRAARDANEDVDQMLSQFARAAAGGGMEWVTALGVSYADVTAHVRSMNESMDSAEGKSLALRHALELLAAETDGTSNEAATAGDAMRTVEVALTNMRDAASLAMGENRELVAALAEMGAGIGELLPQVIRIAQAIGGALSMGMDHAREAALRLEEHVQLVADSADWIRDTFSGQLPQFYNDYADFMETQASHLSSLNDTMIRSASTAVAAARRIREAEESWNRDYGDLPSTEGRSRFSTIGGASYPGAPAPSERRGRGLGGGGGGGGAPAPQGISLESMLSLMAEEATLAREIAAYRAEEAEALAELKATMDEVAMLEETRERQARARWDVELRAMERRQEVQEDYLASRQLELEIAQHIEQKQQQQYQDMISYAHTAGNFVGVMGNLFGELAAQEEKGSENADKWRKAQGIALGIYETIKAIAAGAEAVGMLGTGNFPGGAAKLVEAAGHGVAAGMAFTQLAQSGGGNAAKTKQAATFRPATQRRQGRTATEQAGNTINVYSWGRSQAEAGAVIADTQWQAVHKGAPLRVPAGVGYRS